MSSNSQVWQIVWCRGYVHQSHGQSVGAATRVKRDGLGMVVSLCTSRYVVNCPCYKLAHDVIHVTLQHVCRTQVMKLSAKVRAAGPNFVLLGKDDCMIKSKKPVIAVTAVRTGCGKSQVCTVHAALQVAAVPLACTLSCKQPRPSNCDLLMPLHLCTAA